MNNYLIDSHCHLYKEYYDDVKSILDKSKLDGVNYFITDGINKETNMEVLDLAQRENNVYVTLGIHPEEVENFTEEDLDFIESNLSNPKVIAIGEIGLDYHYDNYDKTKQIYVFEKQLQLAIKYNIPVVIHCRDAYFDTLSLLKKYKVKGVIHCFSGSKEIAEEFIKLGLYLGVTGVVTFDKAKLIDTIGHIGIDKFILETDSPYLTPVPLRGHKNYPGNVKYIAEFICSKLNINYSDLINVTSNNVLAIFDKIKVE